MENKLLYNEVINGYNIMENIYATLFELVIILQNNNEISNNQKLNKLIIELEAEKKSIVMQKEKFIRTFSPILNDEKEFKKHFSSFKSKDNILKEHFIVSMKERIKMLKIMRLKLSTSNFISNFSQKILKGVVIFIIANTFLDFIEIPNRVILFITYFIISFFSGYILAVLTYRKTLNKVFELFKTKQYRLLFEQ